MGSMVHAVAEEDTRKFVSMTPYACRQEAAGQPRAE